MFHVPVGCVVAATAVLAGCVAASASPTGQSIGAFGSNASNAPASIKVATATPSLPSPSPTAAPERFTSTHLGFSITLTTDYSEAPWIPGPWNGVVGNLAGDPGTDGWMNNGPTGGGIEFGILAVPAGTTATTWAAHEAPRTKYSDCGLEPQTTTVAIGGLPVVLEKESCPEYFVLDAMWVRGHEGVLAQWASIRGRETADTTTFIADLATIRWN